MIGPDASAAGLALRTSSASATSRIRSSRSSRFSFCFAETRATCVVPPHSSGCRPSFASSPRTRSGFASGRSILLTATTIGTSAARACEIDSRVCGITPSSAATTSTAMSVALAPRARIAVNASWPGVSRKVILRPSTVVWYAPMCCVIPPASVSTTAVSRIASSSVVLPWSTWPMIVTTGGRSCKLSSGSSKASGSGSSSAACLIVTSRFSSAASSSTSSSDRDWFAFFICPRFINSLISSATEVPSACEKSRRVTPDSTVTGPVGGATSRGVFGWRGSARSPGRCRCPAPGRPLPASITTRRFRLPGPPPPLGLIGLPPGMNPQV